MFFPLSSWGESLKVPALEKCIQVRYSLWIKKEILVRGNWPEDSVVGCISLGQTLCLWPVGGIQGREKTGRREPLSSGELHSPAATSPSGRKWGGPPEGRKKPQNEAVWWPRVLIPSFPSFLVPPSLHFPGACARSSALPSAPNLPATPRGRGAV